MKGRAKWLTVCALVTIGFALPAQAQQTRTIYLVRHADKASEETDAALSDAGKERAKCLANTLRDANIGQIFTSELQRTQQTAAPLAGNLGLKPIAVPLSKVDDLIRAIRSSQAPSVLVVWHDATLPAILRTLGAPEIRPIGHTEYDRFFVLTLSRDGDAAKTGFASLRYCDCTK